MRSFLLCSLLLSAVYAHAQLAPSTPAPLLAHLLEVNAEWQAVAPTAELQVETTFADENARIAAHLHLVADRVEQAHRSSAVVADLMAELRDYADAQTFPINLAVPHRQPVFIDHRGVACAVGHLMRENGFEAEANKVHNTINLAYLREIPTAWLEDWKQHSELTLEEMAWIQPGYPLGIPWTNHGDYLDGTVYDLVVWENELYVAGEMTLYGLPHTLLKYNGTFLEAIDGEPEGVIYDLEVYNGKLLGAGHFDGTGNVMTYTGDQVTLEQVGGPEAGAARCLDVAFEVLLLGVDQPFGGAVMGQDGGLWFTMGTTNGPVHAVAPYDFRIWAGGAFTEATDLEGDVVSCTNLAALDAAGWVPHSHPTLVRSLEPNGAELVLTADFDQETNYHAFALYDGSEWVVPAFAPQSFGNNVALYGSIPANGSWLVFGDWANYPAIGSSTGGIATLTIVDEGDGNPDGLVVPGAEWMSSSLNEGIRAAVWFEGELWAGGDFTGSNEGVVNHLMSTDAFTGVEELQASQLNLYPNPTTASLHLDIPGSMNSTIHILNMAGQRIQTAQVTPAAQSIDVSTLPTGTYILEVVHAGTLRRERFVKIQP